MGWWGKLVGGAFGFMLGGPLGALLGGVLGHNFDRGLGRLGQDERFRPGDRERVQTAFFTATFSVMGHLAKADGRISPQEIALAEAVMAQMDLDGERRRAAIRLFEQGKARDFPLGDVLDQFRRECHGRSTLIGMFIEIQLQAAYADGRLDLISKGPLDAPGGPAAEDHELDAWFNHEERKALDEKIIFGHWASLQGHTSHANAIGLDTGCVWGRQLTAVRLDKRVPRVIQVEGQQR